MTGYRYIKVPLSIVIVDDDDKPLLNEKGVQREISFYEFLRPMLRDQLHFGQTMDGILASVSLDREFKDKKPGYVAKVSEAEWVMLNASIEKPSGKYVVALATQIVPFLLAVVKAPTEPPEIETNAATTHAPS